MYEQNQFPENENKPEGAENQNPPSPEREEMKDTSFQQYASFGGYSQPPQPPQMPKKPRKTLFWVTGLVALYLVLVLGLVGLISSGTLKFADADEEEKGQESSVQTEEEKQTEKTENAPIKENPSEDGDHAIVGEDYTGEKLSAATLYENNVECVVFVQANYARGTATGSGFVIDGENGYILTNHHVVEECQDIAVTFSNGDSYTATLIGGDSINDVAVLKIEKKGLKNVTIGNSDNLKIGDDLLVIGNPLGDLTFTLTKGVISGVDRTINTGEYNIDTFQTDAAINSGNSGGPAFDATGAVVGIASAKYAATGVEGIGFCIPINDAMEIAKDLVEYGYVTGRPNFGISVSDSSGYEYTTDEWGRRVVVESMPGARVEEVGKGSCAEKAGLKVGDVVTKLGDVKITTANELINAKNKYKAGDTVTLEVYRDGQTVTLTATLDEYTPSK
ncbi:MAG: trypsin-like peptidase domain-containing protein [Clostridia bacterium]|nr:trypsin-like peptidase domain-containing protein [Clostridia bacterium]